MTERRDWGDTSTADLEMTVERLTFDLEQLTDEYDSSHWTMSEDDQDSYRREREELLLLLKSIRTELARRENDNS